MPHDPLDAGILWALCHLGTLRMDASRRGDAEETARLAAVEASILLLWESVRQLRQRVTELEHRE